MRLLHLLLRSRVPRIVPQQCRDKASSVMCIDVLQDVHEFINLQMMLIIIQVDRRFSIKSNVHMSSEVFSLFLFLLSVNQMFHSSSNRLQAHPMILRYAMAAATPQITTQVS